MRGAGFGKVSLLMRQRILYGECAQAGEKLVLLMSIVRRWTESDTVFVSQPHLSTSRYSHFRDFVARDSWFVKVSLLMQRRIYMGALHRRIEKLVSMIYIERLWIKTISFLVIQSGS